MPCRCVQAVTRSTLETQWDNLANLRLLQIMSGQDITYNRVLMPAIFETIGERYFNHCLDVGSGVGVLTSALQMHCAKVVGIDISPRSVELASKTFAGDRLRFDNVSVEDHSLRTEGAYDLAVANMFLMDAINLDDAVSAIHRSLSGNGTMLAVVPHPAYWPDHYGYGSDPWFEYSREIAVECNFHISLSNSQLSTIHFHRPLQSYLDAFLSMNFRLIRFSEIMPSAEVRALYPTPWRGPRYVLFELKKVP